MRATAQASLTIAFAAQALAHGYIYRVTADNTVYPGWDVRIDPTLNPTPDRIAFGGGDVSPITNLNSSDIACNRGHSPPPGIIAEVRAGSNVTFHWSHWLYSHKGPITAWMAPYEGDVTHVNVNELEFFKFAEDTIDKNGVWGTVRMIDDTNGTWTATIPADIKPGTYVIRQEIIALHFAIATPPGFEIFPVGPQFYMTCFNFNVTGKGDASPKGVKFPGGYNINEAGFHYDIKSSAPYPTVGPAVYKPKYNVKLEPKDHVIVSPTGNSEDDATYYTNQYNELLQQGATVSYFDSIGG